VLKRLGDILHQPIPKRLERRIIACSLITFTLILFVLSLFPNTCCDGRDIEKLKRQANLRSVSSIVRSFPTLNDEGSFPTPDQYGESLTHWVNVWPESVFGHEDTQDDIWIVPIPWPDRRIPEDITQEELAQLPLLHEHIDLNPDGTSVAFWDGQVEFLSNEAFEAIIDVERSVCLACAFGMNNWFDKREP
jgi:hypothetical protein